MAHKSLINYTKEAFSLPANLTYLSAAVVGTVALFIAQMPALAEPVMLLGAGLEMVFLGLMPHNERFTRAINAKREPATQRVEQQVRTLKQLASLGQVPLEKYTEIYKKKLQISDNFLKNAGSFQETYVAKINTLEAYYVELLFEIDQYEKFLKTEHHGEFDADIHKIEAEMQQATPKVRELYQKRLDLIHKRKGKNSVVRESLQVASIQLDTLEDTVDYLLEQSMTIKNPDEITRTLDNVLSETEEHYNSIREIQGITDGNPIDLLLDASPAEQVNPSVGAGKSIN